MSTIIALSTPVGRGAIAVVRMSGSDSKKIAKAIFEPFPDKPNFLKVGTLALDSFSDRAMCVYFDAPRSYTGEDMVEFHCHGGVGVSGEVLKKCIALGAVMAQNGEFSKRAFINGKQNLSNAEGIIQLIDAESGMALRAGENLLENKLGKTTVNIQNKLTEILAECEAALDYPEEDLEISTLNEIKKKLTSTYNELNSLLLSAETGRLVSGGINIAIVGKSNVGKSSLLNALLGENRAIVSAIAGTTRDTLRESVIYKDVKFNFVDTAGLRATDDEIENLGIERTRESVKKADIVLNVVDEDEKTINNDKPLIIVRNKMDKLKVLPKEKENEIFVSALFGTNIDRLKQKIYDYFQVGALSQDDLILTNARHIDCVEQAKRSIAQAIYAADETTLDCVTVDISEAWQSLGLITGTTASEEIIDKIYEKFCLGK
ncbi:MAG TPA: tRNA uridine-5-carboxymethylaminomethyl(34) synthesis GTPase MnmE [Eubacteriales bacterium]|nr:tRNA uridine-5-carboxymethylaminomethyl(34) synthesis GTPase MnmE [Eubacteriales bacterium]